MPLELSLIQTDYDMGYAATQELSDDFVAYFSRHLVKSALRVTSLFSSFHWT